MCALRASRRYGRYLKLTAKGALVIDEAKVKAAARLDGKFVVHSNDDTLTAEDMALGYKQLQRVERPGGPSKVDCAYARCFIGHLIASMPTCS